MKSYGKKFDNLFCLSNNEIIKAYVPESYPFALDLEDEIYINKLIGSSSNIFQEVFYLLEKKYSNIPNDVQYVIGSFPWIIRSSGDEDNDFNPNAGAYESLVCKCREDFFMVLTKTLLSGISSKAVRQGKFVNLGNQPRVIPVFIQKLIGNKKAHKIIGNSVPFISSDTVKEITNIINIAHDALGILNLDLEWVLESNYGTISCTSISRKINNYTLDIELSLGFGLFSTQHCTKNLNNMHINSNGEIKYKNNNFISVKVNKTWVIQARTALDRVLSVDVHKLNDELENTLVNNSNVIKIDFEDIIVLGHKFECAKYIVAKTLVQAWDIFIGLSKEKQKEINYVFVEIGSSLEHAGIMFNQTGITVFRCVISRIVNNPKYKAIVNFEDQRIFIADYEQINDMFFDDKNTYTVDYGYLKMYFEQNDYLNVTYNFEPSKRNEYIFPNENFLIIDNGKVYAPCMLHSYLKMRLKNEDKYEKIVACMSRFKSRDILYYVQAVYFNSIDTNFLFIKYKYFKTDKITTNIGLIWLLIKFENNKTDEKLMDVIYSYIDKNNFELDITFYILQRVLLFLENINTFSIFNDDEKNIIYLNVIYVFNSVLCINDMISFLELISDTKLSPFYITKFSNDKELNVKFINCYLKLRKSIFNISNNIIDLKEDFNIVIKNYLDIKQYKLNGNNNIVNTCYQSIVELFDNYSKKIAENLFREYDKELYWKYILSLEMFLEFIKHNTNNINLVFKISKWLKNEYANEKTEHDYNLREYSFESFLDKHLHYKDADLDFNNLHQVHNLLHQWALLEAPIINYNDVPCKLREIIEFSNTFCENDNNLLRFEAGLIEIELAMCTHKASFILSKESIKLEFSEPPETKNDEIARLVALDKIIDRIIDNNFNTEHFYYKELGSWTWVVYANNKNSYNTIDDLKRFILVIRCLLDSSYDFSHTNISCLGEIDNHYKCEVWDDIFAKLLEYRNNFRDNCQHFELNTYVLSTFFTEISTNNEARKGIEECYNNGYNNCCIELVKNIQLLNKTEEIEKWSQVYTSIRHQVMMLVAVWSKELFNDRKKFSQYGEISILLMRNLYVRKDIQKILKNGSVDKNEYDMLLHCVPSLIINDENYKEIADYLFTKKCCYKHAKLFLLFRYVKKIEIRIVKDFIKELEWIPSTENNEDLKIYKNTGVAYNLYKINNSVLGYVRGL